MSNIAYPVQFNYSYLDSIQGVTVLAADAHEPAKRTLKISDLAHTNKSKLNSALYTKKQITVKVAINRNTKQGAEESIDLLLALLQGTEKDLILNQSGLDRRYVCTLEDAVVTTSLASYKEMDLVFTCSDRFGYGTIYTQVLGLVGVTTASRGDAVSFGGSANSQVPVISTTYTAISGGTNKTVTFGNPINGKTLSIQRTWAVSDVLIIDSSENSVQVNGEDVEFTGSIPDWVPGPGYIYYSDDMTSRTFTMSMNYYKRYV